jgi:hypothetical protein
MAAGAIGVLRVHAAPSAQMTLDRARVFANAHAGAKFGGTMSVKGGTARSPIAEAQITNAKVGGRLHSPARVRAVIADDEAATELVLFDRAVYVRAAATPAGLSAARFVRADAQARRVMRVRAEQAKSLDVGAVLAAARHPETLHRRGDVTTVEADVDAASLFGAALAKHVAWGTLRADIGRDGKLQTLRVVTRAEATISSRVQFAHWGEPGIDVAAPAADQVDTTPSVGRANLAAFKTAPLLMPKTLPSGWELVSTGVLPATDTQEGCAQAELAYEDQTRGDAGYLYLYEFAHSCAAPAGEDATPFTAGNYNGFAASQDGPYVQITVGTTTVQAVSDLPHDQLAATLSGLVPLALQSA